VKEIVKEATLFISAESTDNIEEGVIISQLQKSELSVKSGLRACEIVRSASARCQETFWRALEYTIEEFGFLHTHKVTLRSFSTGAGGDSILRSF